MASTARDESPDRHSRPDSMPTFTPDSTNELTSSTSSVTPADSNICSKSLQEEPEDYAGSDGKRPPVHRFYSDQTAANPTFIDPSTGVLDVPVGSSYPRERFKNAAMLVMQEQEVVRKLAEKLCEVCVKLQLSRERFIIKDHSSDSKGGRRAGPFKSFPPGSGSGKFRLGNLRDIIRRSIRCPFCRLVRESLIDFHSKELEDGTYEDTVCHASWAIDGREETRDTTGRDNTRPRTRRIQLHWDNDILEDSYLVLMATTQARPLDLYQQASWESDTLFQGRRITSASIELAKRWLCLCDEHHGDICRSDRGKNFKEMVKNPFFGVVDVQQMKLTSLPPDQPYVALSYMWGNIDQSFMTTGSNAQRRIEPGALGEIADSLPAVIRDAIKLVLNLGMKYIWIDSLCIVQGSSKSWRLNSSLRDQVYGNAYLTICAADGEDATTGLQGISPDRDVPQRSCECDGVQVMVSHLPETYVEKSRWNTRGWTFQERLLSRRCLIFVGGRILFQCRTAAMSEDIDAEQQEAGWRMELVKAPLQLLKELDQRPFYVYMEYMRLYTIRELSCPDDILVAFRGMSNLLSQKFGSPLAFGLPTSHFDLALLWEPLRICRYRIPKNEEDDRLFGSTAFPSWSWCGWQGSSMEYRPDTIAGCWEDVHGWHTEHTWINWYIRDSRGNLRLVWDKDNNKPTASEKPTRWTGYASPPVDSTDDTDNYGRSLNNMRPEQRRYGEFKKTLPEYPFRINIVKDCSEDRDVCQDQQFLQFWTYYARLHVIPHDQTNSKLGDGLDRYDIADYSGDWCGTIVLDDPFDDVSGSEHEFIALSYAKQFTKEENDNWLYYIPHDREQSDWRLYYVLLIKYENGIARRLGLGKVFEDSFMNSLSGGPEWKEIILA